MEQKEIIKKLEKLPPEAQKEASNFVELLYDKYIKQKKEPGFSEKESILNSSFRGIWKGRKDMRDSTEWVRNIRKNRRTG